MENISDACATMDQIRQKKCDESGVPKLLDALKWIDSSMDEINEWASKFGFAKAKGKARKRKAVKPADE
eukprot:82456-Pyramimonas_sp.AAC.2